jgi:hypothetical protein
MARLISRCSKTRKRTKVRDSEPRRIPASTVASSRQPRQSPSCRFCGSLESAADFLGEPIAASVTQPARMSHNPRDGRQRAGAFVLVGWRWGEPAAATPFSDSGTSDTGQRVRFQCQLPALPVVRRLSGGWGGVVTITIAANNVVVVVRPARSPFLETETRGTFLERARYPFERDGAFENTGLVGDGAASPPNGAFEALSPLHGPEPSSFASNRTQTTWL